MSSASFSFNTHCVVALVLAMLCVSCGGGSPSSPSGPKSAGAAIPTYVGNISVGTKTGTIVVSESSTVASLLPRPAMLTALLSWMQVTVYASSASGELLLSDGTAVTLTGTFSGSVFNLSGGGYSLNLTVSGGSISGSGTAPDGSAAVVSPPSPGVTTAPAPPDASGTYQGSYTINAPSYFVDTNIPGSAPLNCTFTTVVTGTLTLTLNANGANNYHAVLSAMWTDTASALIPADTASSYCSQLSAGPPTTPSGPEGSSYDGPPSNMQMAFVTNSTPNGGTQVRVGTFIGGVSGNTIVGSYARSDAYTKQIGTMTHKDGYAASVNVVLTKQ